MEMAAGILFIAVLIYIGARKGMKEAKSEDAVRQQKEAQGIYRFEGRLSVRSEYASPAAGSGRLVVFPGGFEYEIDKGFRGAMERVGWPHVVTFARRGSTIQIEWKTYLGAVGSTDPGPEMASALQFIANEAARIEGMLKPHLTRAAWQANVDFGPEEEWDVYYSTRV